MHLPLLQLFVHRRLDTATEAKKNVNIEWSACDMIQIVSASRTIYFSESIESKNMNSFLVGDLQNE